MFVAATRLLVLHFPLCSAFSARLKIFVKSGQALSSAGCVLQGQIGHRYSNKYKTKPMQRLGGRECHPAQGRRNLRVWCCLVEADISINGD